MVKTLRDTKIKSVCILTYLKSKFKFVTKLTDLKYGFLFTKVAPRVY